MSQKRFNPYIALHILLFVYSISSVFSKLAAGTDLWSSRFFLFYGISILLLVLYAIGWQQILKRLPLTTAYAHKSVTVIWGIFWGVCFLKESLSVKQIIGIVLVLSGVLLYCLAEKGDSHAE